MSRITPFSSAIQKTQKFHATRVAGRTISPGISSMALHRNLKDSKPDTVGGSDFVDRLSNYEMKGSQTTQSFHTVHRPTVASKNYKIVPLMQGFRNSAPKKAFHGLSTIDSHFMPLLKSTSPPPAKLRVPLLPDNYAPDRSPSSGHFVERFDHALPKSEISIVAYHTELGAPIPIDEVVSSNDDNINLNRLK